MTNIATLEPDWKQERPTAAEVELMRKNFKIKALQIPPDSRIETFIQTIKQRFVNGGIKIYQFKVIGDKSFSWFAARNRFDEIDFLNLFLNSKEFREAAKELKPVDNIQIKLDWNSKRTDIFELPGFFGGLIFHGGAFSDKSVNAQTAFKVGSDFVDSLSENRYDEFNFFHLGNEWSKWYYDIAWDCSCFIFDKRNCIVTLICITDTD